MSRKNWQCAIFNKLSGGIKIVNFVRSLLYFRWLDRQLNEDSPDLTRMPTVARYSSNGVRYAALAEGKEND